MFLIGHLFRLRVNAPANFVFSRQPSVFIRVHPWLKFIFLRESPKFPAKLREINHLRIAKTLQIPLSSAPWNARAMARSRWICQPWP
jgi:hypothetical protein